MARADAVSKGAVQASTSHARSVDKHAATAVEKMAGEGLKHVSDGINKLALAVYVVGIPFVLTHLIDKLRSWFGPKDEGDTGEQ